MTTTGRVGEMSTDPRAVAIITSYGPPPATTAFSPLTDDQWTLLLACKTAGTPVTVTGTSPNATKVTG